jgi:uncharacterized protein (TIGR02594 family)
MAIIAKNSSVAARTIRAKEPAWVTAGRKKLGTREAPGQANNPTILGWARRLGTKVLGVIYNADDVPWCGVLVAQCLEEADVTPATFAVRAKSWATWGVNLRPERLAAGAVLVFERPGGGHVGFYVGEDQASYHVLGGNQGDAVSIARIAKERLIASRWPTGVPVIGGPVRLSQRAGVPLSRNEA